jgi:putative serine/threonine protein kinase
MIYQPREDSFLLEKWVQKLARGRVLDMGTGSGIQAQAAAGQKRVKSVLAADIDPAVVTHCKKRIAGKKIRCVASDLFSKIPRVLFDTIVFNPPYLPQELKERDIALEGGKRGYETTVRFLEQANAFLKTDGQILLLFSSLTDKKRVEDAIARQLFAFRGLERLHIFFEDLYVYRIAKSPVLKRIEKSGVKALSYLTRGKRSWVYKGAYRGKGCVVKVRRPDSAARVREGRALALANKLGLGPKLFIAAKDFSAYEFVKGRHLQDVLERSGMEIKRKLFKQLFAQAFVLDQAGLAKEEMLRPLKNALVTPAGKVVLIDFERTHKVQKPRNVTQLCTFAARHGLAKFEDLARLVTPYKRGPSRKNFSALLRGIGL